MRGLRTSLLIVAVALLAGIGTAAAPARSAGAPVLPYRGARHDDETVDRARALVEPLLPRAVAAAESLVGLRLDPDRLDPFLQDIPTAKSRLVPRMRVTGAERQRLIVYVEPLLRGDFPDEAAVLRTLTHEMIHVLIRQNVEPGVYRRLPEWFQEGVSHFLLDQSRDKMRVLTAIHDENPYRGLEGFDKDHTAYPEVTGGYACAELAASPAPRALGEFVRAVLRDGTVDAGFEALEVLDAEMSVLERQEAREAFWSRARLRALSDLEAETTLVAEPYRRCRELYRQGARSRLEAIECFEELVAAYPGTYAAEAGMYWLGKCRYHRRESELALEALDAFDAYRLDYGLRDDLLYYRLLLYRDLDLRERVAVACEEYLGLYPDGGHLEKVEKICQE